VIPAALGNADADDDGVEQRRRLQYVAAAAEVVADVKDEVVDTRVEPRRPCGRSVGTAVRAGDQFAYARRSARGPPLDLDADAARRLAAHRIQHVRRQTGLRHRRTRWAGGGSP
jgi:hypothetical protein